MTARVAGVLLGPLVGAGFYLLLIDTVSLPELYAGCGAVAIAWAAYAAARGQGVTEARVSAGGVVPVWRAAAGVPRQVVVVSAEALAQLLKPKARRGVLRAVPFTATDGDAADTGRIALAEGFGSLAPNTIVIGVDSDRNLLLVHQLHRTGGREQLDVLRLG